MRRMKDMAATQPGMSFYAELPDNYNLIVNTSQPVIAKILDEAEKALDDKIAPLRKAMNEGNEQLSAIRAEIKDNKPTDEQSEKEKALMQEVDKSRKEQEEIIGKYASEKPIIKQVIDIALLGNGLLQGRDLSEFIKRSISML